MEFGLQINQSVKVTRIGQEDWYATSVQDVADNSFCISIPSRGPNMLALQNGDLIKLTFIYEDNRFVFETTMLGKRYDNIPLYILALPKECERIQLRSFVRWPIVMDILYAGLPEEGHTPVFSTCYSVDLSGRGVRILLPRQYPVNAKLLLKFTIPFKDHNETIEVTGKVVRSSPAVRVKGYYIGIDFLDINRKKQDLIVRFIFAKMTSQSLARHSTKGVLGSGKKGKV